MAESLRAKTWELVGIAAAVAGHCQPCFAYHYKEALNCGATPEEIQEAVEMARAVRGVGDRHMDEFVARRIAADLAAASGQGGNNKGQ